MCSVTEYGAKLKVKYCKMHYCKMFSDLHDYIIITNGASS